MLVPFAGRRSLHAHITIWLEGHDRSVAAASVTASIPAQLKPQFAQATNPHQPDIWQEPSCPAQRELLKLVLRKQIHSCTPPGQEGCCKTGPCKWGFPYRTPCVSPVHMDIDGNRFLYPRRRAVDRNVVPYHPILLLLWKGHMNIQFVTNTQWSFYLLKYQLKVRRLQFGCQTAPFTKCHRFSLTFCRARTWGIYKSTNKRPFLWVWDTCLASSARCSVPSCSHGQCRCPRRRWC